MIKVLKFEQSRHLPRNQLWLKASISQILEPSPKGLISSMYIEDRSRTSDRYVSDIKTGEKGTHVLY